MDSLRLELQDRRINLVDDAADKAIGYVTWEEEGGVLIVTHTIVHPDYSGRGLAGRLMEAVVSYAKDKGLKLSATCSYAAMYFAKHEELSSCLAD